MSQSNTDLLPRFRIVHVPEIEPVPCPCGSVRRAFVDDPDHIASLHVVDIKKDSETHYHKEHTELYYVLAGEGQIELDGQRFDIREGTSILIKAGCRHRAMGKLRLLNVPIPAFDPQDEWLDEVPRK